MNDIDESLVVMVRYPPPPPPPLSWEDVLDIPLPDLLAQTRDETRIARAKRTCAERLQQVRYFMRVVRRFVKVNHPTMEQQALRRRLVQAIEEYNEAERELEEVDPTYRASSSSIRQMKLKSYQKWFQNRKNGRKYNY